METEGIFRWNNVAKELPAESGDYLVACGAFFDTGEKFYTYMVTSYSAQYQKWNHYDSQGEDFSDTFDDVDYWMEIPALPVAKEQEQME